MVRRLLYLNGLAILGVILFHGAGWGFVAMFSWTARYQEATAVPFSQMGSTAYYVLRGIEQLVVATIPAFLFVSGYFAAFAAGRSGSIGWRVVWGRVKKFVPPYLFWGIIALAMLAAEGVLFSPLRYVVSFLTGDMTPAYYYIPLIIQLYAISPFLAPLARNHWRPLLLAALLLQLLVHLLQLPLILGFDVPIIIERLALIPKWFFPARLLWFVLGMVVGFNLNSFKRVLTKWKWPLLVFTLLFIPLGMIEWESLVIQAHSDWFDHRETLVDTLYGLGFILTFIAFDKVTLPWEKTISDLGSKAFGIYLAHIPVMEVVARGTYHVAPGLLAYQLPFAALVALVGLAVPLLLMRLMDTLPPIRRYYNYVFG